MAEQIGVAGAKVPGCVCGAGGFLGAGFQTQGSQLAIFYGGSIHVFDSISPERAQAIMLIATASSAAAAAAAVATSAQSSTGADRGRAPAAPLSELAPAPDGVFCKIAGELPLARRNSLQRFLQKRRERCLSLAPYNAAIKSPATPESCSGSESSDRLGSPIDATASS